MKDDVVVYTPRGNRMDKPLTNAEARVLLKRQKARVVNNDPFSIQFLDEDLAWPKELRGK